VLGIYPQLTALVHSNLLIKWHVFRTDKHPMNKTRQQLLFRWLKQQSPKVKGWMRLSMLLGVITGLLIIAQAWLIATLLHQLIVNQVSRQTLLTPILLMLLTFLLRALVLWLREQIGFHCGRVIRQSLRQQVLDRLAQLGPAWIQGKPAGSWASLILEQIEDMHDFYARYLPQMTLAGIVPLLILISIFPINWAAGLILLFTAPLIPLFMALVGMGAADANRRNFVALARLSGHFLDSLKGLDTLRLFYRADAEQQKIRNATETFRQRTMEVLRLAFLSSAVLEFFAAISIAVAAVYFGFSYLGELHFGNYGTPVTLFSGFLVLILAPEFFQPLRDLGTFYHAKAQAVGAAESLEVFLSETDTPCARGTQRLEHNQPLTICAQALTLLSIDGKQLAGPLTFTLQAGARVALVGVSGAGKSSLINTLLGFLPYQGSLQVNGVELRELDMADWRQQLSWVGQNPQLPATTLRDNLLLKCPEASEQQLQQALDKAYVSEFLPLLPDGLETRIGDSAARLSVGQAQRIAVARALLVPCQLLLLDEPTASLDAHSEQRVLQALNLAAEQQTTLLVTHQLEEAKQCDEVWVMEQGRIVEQGSYHTLLEQAGPFAHLFAQRVQEL
jgi:ATP-binding cassette subfamily C protein CydD